MISLFIDTSLSDVSIALVKDNILLSKIHEDIPQKHSVYVVKYIENILKENKLSPKNVDEIIVVNGPGSFTGIRIGVTIAKTYAYLLNIRIVTITSLQARIIGLKGKCFLSLIDAKRDNYYVGLYDENYNKITEGFMNINRVNELKLEYSPEVVDIDKEYNIEKIIAYTKKIPSANPHSVNPLYLKEPEAVEKKSC